MAWSPATEDPQQPAQKPTTTTFSNGSDSTGKVAAEFQSRLNLQGQGEQSQTQFQEQGSMAAGQRSTGNNNNAESSSQTPAPKSAFEFKAPRAPPADATPRTTGKLRPRRGHTHRTSPPKQNTPAAPKPAARATEPGEIPQAPSVPSGFTFGASNQQQSTAGASFMSQPPPVQQQPTFVFGSGSSSGSGNQSQATTSSAMPNPTSGPPPRVPPQPTFVFGSGTSSDGFSFPTQPSTAAFGQQQQSQSRSQQQRTQPVATSFPQTQQPAFVFGNTTTQHHQQPQQSNTFGTAQPPPPPPPPPPPSSFSVPFGSAASSSPSFTAAAPASVSTAPHQDQATAPKPPFQSAPFQSGPSFVSISEMMRSTTSTAPGAPKRKSRTKSKARPPAGAGATTPAQQPTGNHSQWQGQGQGQQPSAGFPNNKAAVNTANAHPSFGAAHGPFSGPQGHQQPSFSMPQLSVMDTIIKDAETYRGVGNDYFKKQNYQEAFILYTKAINTLIPYPQEEVCRDKLALYFSNRAAASLAMGRPLQALQDCRMGLHHKPGVMKCMLRMATCYARLGEYDQAREVVHQAKEIVQKKVLEASSKNPIEEKAAAIKELSEVESKGKELEQSEAVLRDVLRALSHDVPAMPSVDVLHPAPKRASLADLLKHLEAYCGHFPHAEAFHAARADALLRLGRFKDAETAINLLPHEDAPKSKLNAAWRKWLSAQVAFHQGEATQALQLLAVVHPLAVAISSNNSSGGDATTAATGVKSHSSGTLESIIVPMPSPDEIQALIAALGEYERERASGNEAVGSKKYESAIEIYTKAAGPGNLSPALAAVLYCNRAAAHHGLGNLALAVSDCCRAKALSPKYAKAHSRLAAILSELRMHSEAANELSAALEILELPDTSKKDYQKRLKAAKEAGAPRRMLYGATQSKPPADHYKLLGVKKGCTTDEVRKAYKQLALKLHPDKATSSCRVSFRVTTVGAELSHPAAEIQHRLQENATWLFKFLGEAHDTLNCPNRRKELDADMANWEAAGGYNGSRSSPTGRGGSGGYGYDFGADSFSGFTGYAPYSPPRNHTTYGGYSAYTSPGYGTSYFRPHSQPSYNYRRQNGGGGGGGQHFGGRSRPTGNYYDF